ncbi:MAG: hypothetical protein JSR58_01955 [Verrucomicrobia bacterium]|nr:hypothetical protein [Verrucomicrobiota bacterium]
MNILPFVLSFLLLMSLLVGSMLKEMRGMALEKRVIVGEIHATQQRLSGAAKTTYDKETKAEKKTNGQGQGSTQTQPSSESKKKIKTYRSYYCEVEGAKFQLSSLLDKPQSAKISLPYDIAVQLLEDLYGRAPFWKPGLAIRIVDKLIEWKDGDITSLFASDKELNPIFQKMLMGTNTYDIENEKGYPPFFDFFTLNERANKRAIVFKYASYPVLQAAIGKESIILLKELEKDGGMSMDDFIKFLGERPKGKKFHKSEHEVFYFGGTGKITTMAIDSSSVISRKKPITQREK